MAKQTVKTMKITDLKVDFNTNVRLPNNYDIGTMKDQIVQAGRIQKPIVINGDTGIVLQGNRRTLAGQELFNDPACPSDLKATLEKVQVIVYTGLTPQEEVGLIMDHGGERPICRTEVVLSVWRLDMQFYGEAEICVWMLNALASYTGNMKKLNQLPTEATARNKAIKTWLHGTVGNYILASSKMGDFVKEQFILHHKSEDKLLQDGEKVTMWCSRDRISALNTAKNDDMKDGTWDSEKGGPKFNALIEEYVKQDAGEKKPTGPRAMSQKDMNEKADQFKSPAIKSAFKVAAGDPDAGRTLVDIDNAMYRYGLVMETLAKEYNEVTNPHMQNFLSVLLNANKPAAAVADALAPFKK